MDCVWADLDCGGKSSKNQALRKTKLCLLKQTDKWDFHKKIAQGQYKAESIRILAKRNPIFMGAQ
jgi:hypothetical protein